VTDLRDVLAACVPLVPGPFCTEHARLFEPEHLDRLAARLLRFHRGGVLDSRPPPHFSAECSPPVGGVFAVFADALRLWEAAPGLCSPAVPRAFADAVVRAGCPGLLLLLGQRRTPASLTDARAIPPPRATLLAAAARPCGERDPLTAGARALSKHVHRSAEAFWGEVRGSAGAKNRAAEAVVGRILGGATWWNVFGHYKHGTVFEARVATGHGARWGRDGIAFIGFLEPFDEDRWPETTGEGR
jgi:hypothetical protein